MRRRIRPSDGIDSRAVESFDLACDDTFTKTWFGECVFGSTDDARKAWPRCRRAVWAVTDRMRLPRAAIVFDGMSYESKDAILLGFSHRVFPLQRVTAALAHDRAALEAFIDRDPRAAGEIGDYLDVFRADLALIERQARELAQTSGDRRYPGHDWTGSPYGGRHGDDEAA